MENQVEGINELNVTSWMKERIVGLKPPLNFEKIAGGHSNLTFKVSDQDGNAFVLRRPPLGHVLESAHDMGREYKIISSLKGSVVPVAPTIDLCLDADVNGAPFYVMEYVAGPVPHDSSVVRDKIPAMRDRLQLSKDVIRVLGELHLLNPDDVGLGDLGRKEAYLERQLKRWSKQWEATETHEVPAMNESTKRLRESMPEQVGASIVHGDYRLGNMIVNGGVVSAILDWELCTLGDPLADLGYLLNNWSAPGEGEEDVKPTSAGGFADRDDLLEQYGGLTGKDLSQINYYRAFSHWRSAAIGQGVYKRYLVGAMGENPDYDLEASKRGINLLAEAALELLG